ncbi:YdbL family protein [Candidatus Electrothrix sp.]|uniref:YdbL family protein n=1 Tax=Candidatus Electrothrix sp. TaxID=2170559 RepID=UPI004057B484
MKNTTTLFLCCLFTLLLCQPIFALELSDAKSQGLVGETPTGYLDVVKASPEATELIKEINAKRKTHYQEIAKKNKTPLSTVEKLAGQKAMEKTPAGQYVKVEGKWEKK